MTEQLVLAIVPSTVLAIVSFLLGRANKKADLREAELSRANQELSALLIGLKSLLRVQLIEYHDRYVEEGKIPHYAMDNYSEMYDAYHKLGGNGTVTAMYERVQHLPQY